MRESSRERSGRWQKERRDKGALVKPGDIWSRKRPDAQVRQQLHRSRTKTNLT